MTLFVTRSKIFLSLINSAEFCQGPTLVIMNPLTAVLFTFALLFSMSAGSPSVQYHVEVDSIAKMAVNALVSQLRIKKGDGTISYGGAPSGTVSGYPSFHYNVFAHIEAESFGPLTQGYIHIKLEDKRSCRTSSYKVGLYISTNNRCFRYSSVSHDPMHMMPQYDCVRSYELTVDPC